MKTSVVDFYNYIRPKKLLDSVTIIVMLLVVGLLVSNGIIFSQMAVDIIDKQTQKRAIQTARQLAILPEIQEFAVSSLGSQSIDRLTRLISRQTDVKDIIIVNSDRMILSHPDPAAIGTRYSDPLADRALNFGSSYSQETRENGIRFIRGTVPIIDKHHRIIGMVSAGYPIDSIRNTSRSYVEKIVFFTFVFITLGLIAAIFIAKGVKWVIFGLEPSEIAHMFEERSVLIESIREGIISTDAQGYINLVNEAALRTLGLQDRKQVEKLHLSAFLPGLDIHTLLGAEEEVSDREMILAGVPIIVNVERIGNGRGLVVTFRKKEEIDMIVRELSQVQTFSDMLRAQTHEYSNNLHTIVGLIQIGAYDEVLRFIADETEGHRKLIRFLAEKLPDRILSSMIIGKYMHASEQKVVFTIDPESRMIDIPGSLDRHTLTTALGNIIDNAIEAAGLGGKPARVSVFMSDYGTDLLFEVEDSGKGIPEKMIEKIFEKGISTKTGTQHGYGLYLAKRSVDILGGLIEVIQDESAGTRFEIVIPKERFGT
jgi:sensor histidine kinase regulating citrate/malate metabolism